MKKLKWNNIDLLNIVKLFFWSLTVFSYFFQFPFMTMSKFIVPSLASYLFFLIAENGVAIKKDYLFLVCLFLLYISISCLYSVLKLNNINIIIRFYLILSMLIIVTLINYKNIDKEYNVIIFFAFIKCLVLIGIFIYLLKIGNHNVIRDWAKKEGVGDIYLTYGMIPKVQVHGNGILVLIFISYYLRKKINPVSVVLFLGVIAAGNFAFLLALFLFFIYISARFLLSSRNKYGLYFPVVIIFILIIAPFLFNYLDKKIIQKQHSNAIRVEQANVLLDTNLILGNGLGNRITTKGFFRDYTDNIYFELQTLYILNQIGLIGLLMFYFTTLYYTFKKSKTSGVIYLIYLVYTFWNPYCFDTTHIIALILIINQTK